jgi:hypothetical protein
MIPIPNEIHRAILSWLVDDLSSILMWARASRTNYDAAIAVLYKRIQCEAFDTLVNDNPEFSRFVSALHFRPTAIGAGISTVAVNFAADCWANLSLSKCLTEFVWAVRDPLSCIFPDGVPVVLHNLTVLKLRLKVLSAEDFEDLVSFFFTLAKSALTTYHRKTWCEHVCWFSTSFSSARLTPVSLTVCVKVILT